MNTIGFENYKEFAVTFNTIADEKDRYFSIDPTAPEGSLPKTGTTKDRAIRTRQIVDIAKDALTSANQTIPIEERIQLLDNLKCALTKYSARVISAFRRRWWCRILYFFGYRPHLIKEVSSTLEQAQDRLTTEKKTQEQYSPEFTSSKDSLQKVKSALETLHDPQNQDSLESVERLLQEAHTTILGLPNEVGPVFRKEITNLQARFTEIVENRKQALDQILKDAQTALTKAQNSHYEGTLEPIETLLQQARTVISSLPNKETPSFEKEIEKLQALLAEASLEINKDLDAIESIDRSITEKYTDTVNKFQENAKNLPVEKNLSRLREIDEKRTDFLFSFRSNLGKAQRGLTTLQTKADVVLAARTALEQKITQQQKEIISISDSLEEDFRKYRRPFLFFMTLNTSPLDFNEARKKANEIADLGLRGQAIAALDRIEHARDENEFLLVFDSPPPKDKNEVKKLYRTQSRIFHSDKSQEPSNKEILNTIFSIISGAKDIIMNDSIRYDTFPEKVNQQPHPTFAANNPEID